MKWVHFINDSKATNVNATFYALECMVASTVWIVGGVDKGNDYSILEGLVKQKVLGIVCLGKDNSKIKDAFGSIVESFFEASSANQAVQISYRIAKKGYSITEIESWEPKRIGGRRKMRPLTTGALLSYQIIKEFIFWKFN